MGTTADEILNCAAANFKQRYAENPESSHIEHGVWILVFDQGESCRFSPLWSKGPRLHGGNPIGYVPASRGGVYIESTEDQLVHNITNHLVRCRLVITSYYNEKRSIINTPR